MLQRIKDLTPGRSITWKPFLITYEVYRVDEDLYALSHTSDGWWTAYVDKEELYKVVGGEIKLSTLNWE